MNPFQDGLKAGFDRFGTIEESNEEETAAAAAASEEPADAISSMCQQLSQELTMLSKKTEDESRVPVNGDDDFGRNQNQVRNLRTCSANERKLLTPHLCALCSSLTL